MLLVCLLAIAYLVFSNLVVIRFPDWIRAIFGVMLIIPGLLSFANIIWPLLLLGIVLTVGMCLALYYPQKKWVFPVCSLILTGLALGRTLQITQQEIDRLNDLAMQYPFESLESRIPEARPEYRPNDLSPTTDEWLSNIEKNHYNYREFLLRRIHDEQVNEFLKAPGFGMQRRAYMYDDAYSIEPIAQIKQRSGSSESVRFSIKENPDLVFRDLHTDSMQDFLDPHRFGYVKDRKQVAGFVSHGFANMPKPKLYCEINRLDLVSLLLHNEPQVYVSENLPRMDDLKKSALRPLNAFEKEALEKLRKGENIVVGIPTEESRLMLGAIRTTAHCIKCHGGKRGDLLGAFSYELRLK